MNTHKNYLYIANWKSYLTYHQSVTWLQKHNKEVAELNQHHKIVLCADFLTIAHAHHHKLPLILGAQTCSAHEIGAYTGEIPAQSLRECGITYCLVGHSERRRWCHETVQESAQKITMLLQHAITPIICVSENYKQELMVLLPALHTYNNHVVVAYEPVSAIGTGILPSMDHIETAIGTIKTKIEQAIPQSRCLCLYGGSVNSSNSKELKKINGLDGFLIGKASTDFQELKKIVE